MKWILKSLFLAWILMLALFHSGVMQKPGVQDSGQAKADWIDAKDFGIHQLILSGPAYGRGLKAGELTRHLLEVQEDTLNHQLDGWLPERWMRQAGVLLAIAWFQGIDKYLNPEHVAEMYGVSKFAPEKYNYLADPFTRQVAYHGLHEVGQMMVDQGFEGMGCTVAAVKRGKNWVLGRNFDFEGGRIFDTQKIMKWVFPENRYAYVSVIWAGMVGAVTGVNEKGVYVSINAAGSDDFRRVGTPSTLVILKILEEADSTAAAVKILEEARVFISDIYVVNDRQGDLRVIEKTPKRMAHYSLTKNGAVANHLISEIFSSDKTNQWRKEELTSISRLERGQKLVEAVPVGLDAEGTVLAVLSILRDKGVDAQGLPLTLGNRRAIDALIATHSVIWDGSRSYLYVSQGPALTGKFLGFDLNASFANRRPIRLSDLPSDPQLSETDFYRFKENTNTIARAHHLARAGKCIEAKALLESVRGLGREQAEFYHALGDTQECLAAPAEARVAFETALKLTPAYAKQERAIKRRLGR